MVFLIIAQSRFSTRRIFPCEAERLLFLKFLFLDKGSYTRFPTRNGDSPSLIDYFLVESPLLGKVRSFDVKPLTNLSDHCCLRASINTDFCIDIEDQHIPEQINLPRPL